jgi:hypothetical protein
MKRVMYLSIIAILLLSLIVLAYTASTQIAHAQANSTAISFPDFNFAAAGDWGCSSNTNNTIHSMQSKNPELVLGLGDYSYKNTAGCWLQMIDPIDEKMKIIIGSHESEPLSLLNQYMNHFNLTKQYYSFDYQNVHFIAISTELPWTKSSAQYKFVKDDLLKTSIDPNIGWIVIFYHVLHILHRQLNTQRVHYGIHIIHYLIGIMLIMYCMHIKIILNVLTLSGLMVIVRPIQ